MAIILIIKTEDGGITELPLLNKIIIGRSSSSDYTIHDSKMSGQHCSFEFTPQDQIKFTDLGSTNGSYFNNSKITQSIFKINDVIRIGNTEITIEEKRLSIGERRSIGISNQINNDKTLPSLEDSKKKTEKPDKKKSPIRRNIVGVIDKNIKERIRQPVDLSNVDVVLDQEASTGDTKMLKLDKDSTSKKNK